MDLFLVLSAFLLTRLLREEIERTGTVNYRHYFVRRICRIWPLHWSFVTALLIFVWLNDPAEKVRASWEWLSHILFFNNVVIAFGGYGTALPHSQHLWTISLEEQFYLVIPIIVPFLLRRQAAWTAILGSTFAALWFGRTLCVLLAIPHPFIWTLPLRMDSMVLGAAMGLGAFDGLISRARGGQTLAAGVVLLSATSFLPAVETVGLHQVVLYTLVDVGCLLLVVGVLRSRALTALLSLSPFRYLGKVSFGIYVYHLVVLYYVRVLLTDVGIAEPWTVFVVAWCSTCLVAGLSFEVLEKPFLKLKSAYTTVASRPV